MEGEDRRVRTLPSLATALRHRLVVAILTACAVMAAVGAYAFTIGSSYTSTTLVLILPSVGNPLTPEMASAGSNQISVGMATEASVVTTPSIYAAAGAAGMTVVPGPGEQVLSEVPSGTQTVQITYTAGTAERAQQGAQLIAETYLAERESNSTSVRDAQVEALQAQLTQAEESLTQATADAQSGDNVAEQQQAFYATLVEQLNSRISSAQALDTAPGRILNPADLPTEPSGPSLVLLLGAGVTLSLGIGLAVALVTEWRRDLVREGETLDVCGIPVFASIPFRNSSEASVSASSIVADLGDAVVTEAYRRLRAGVLAGGRTPHVLAVSAVGAREHASTISANLAVLLVDAGFAVSLVSANPRSGALERTFGVVSRPVGMAEVIRGEATVLEVLIRDRGVALLPVGRDPVGSREFYAGPRFRHAVKQLQEQSDFVIIDAAPTGSADGDAAIAAADSVLLTVTVGVTTHEQVEAALDRFAQLGVLVTGAVNASPQLTRQSEDARDVLAANASGEEAHKHDGARPARHGSAERGEESAVVAVPAVDHPTSEDDPPADRYGGDVDGDPDRAAALSVTGRSDLADPNGVREPGLEPSEQSDEAVVIGPDGGDRLARQAAAAKAAAAKAAAAKAAAAKAAAAKAAAANAAARRR